MAILDIVYSISSTQLTQHKICRFRRPLHRRADQVDRHRLTIPVAVRQRDPVGDMIQVARSYCLIRSHDRGCVYTRDVEKPLNLLHSLHTLNDFFQSKSSQCGLFSAEGCKLLASIILSFYLILSVPHQQQGSSHLWRELLQLTPILSQLGQGGVLLKRRQQRVRFPPEKIDRIGKMRCTVQWKSKTFALPPNRHFL